MTHHFVPDQTETFYPITGSSKSFRGFVTYGTQSWHFALWISEVSRFPWKNNTSVTMHQVLKSDDCAEWKLVGIIRQVLEWCNSAMVRWFTSWHQELCSWYFISLENSQSRPYAIYKGFQCLVNVTLYSYCGHHFTEDIVRSIFNNEKHCVLIKTSIKFVPKNSFNNDPALVYIMTPHQTGTSLLSEVMMD